MHPVLPPFYYLNDNSKTNSITQLSTELARRRKLEMAGKNSRQLKKQRRVNGTTISVPTDWGKNGIPPKLSVCSGKFPISDQTARSISFQSAEPEILAK